MNEERAFCLNLLAMVSTITERSVAPPGTSSISSGAVSPDVSQLTVSDEPTDQDCPAVGLIMLAWANVDHKMSVKVKGIVEYISASKM